MLCSALWVSLPGPWNCPVEMLRGALGPDLVSRARRGVVGEVPGEGGRRNAGQAENESGMALKAIASFSTVFPPAASFPSRFVIGRPRGEAGAERRREELNGTATSGTYPRAPEVAGRRAGPLSPGRPGAAERWGVWTEYGGHRRRRLRFWVCSGGEGRAVGRGTQCPIELRAET